MRLRFASSIAAAAVLAACASKPAAPPSQATVDAYVAQATSLAGNDLKPLLALCRPQPAARVSGELIDRGLAQRLAQMKPAEPGQAFDNLYYVGTDWVAAWILVTSDGIILFDGMNTVKEAQEIIEGGMAKLGLDPNRIKYIVVTHAHGDHYGGVGYLAGKHKARVVSSDLDWKQMEGNLEFPSKLWPDPPRRDVTVADGQKLTLGDGSVTFYITPGHTLGTLSPVIDVRHRGAPHKVLLWGGSSFNFGRDLPRLDSYIAQTERLRRITRDSTLDAIVSNHSSFDAAVAKLDLLRTRGRAGANPFVLGTSGVDRSLQVMGTCARAQKERFLMAP